MKTKNSYLRLLAVLLGLLLAGFVQSALPAIRSNADEQAADMGWYNRSSDDVLVTEGYDISSLYPSYVLDDYVLNTMADNRQARIDAGFSSFLQVNYSWQNLRTTLYETKEAYAAAENASVRLFDHFTGAFTTIGTPLMYGGRDLAYEEADYTEFTFVITDANRLNNVIELRVQDNSVGNGKMVVAYNGETKEFAGGIWGEGLAGAFRHNEYNGVNYPFFIYFDAQTKKIKTEYRLAYEFDLAENFPAFRGFEEYSVDLVFRGINTDETSDKTDGKARFYMYELCGQTLYKESAGIPDEKGPYISFSLPDNAEDIYQNGEIVIPSAAAYDLLVTAEITGVEVIGPQDTEITLESGKFQPTQTGEYTVIYHAKDANNFESERSFTFVLNEIFDPQEMEGGYQIEESYTIELDRSGSVLPAPIVDDRWTYVIEVYAGEDTDFSDALAVGESEYVFTSVGQYTLRYQLILHGNIQHSKYVIAALNVQDTIPPVISEVTVASVYRVGQVLSVPQATATDLADGTVNVTAKVTKEGVEIAISDGKVQFTEAGEYKLIYTATDSAGLSSQKEYLFTVEEQPAEDDEEQDNMGGNNEHVTGEEDQKGTGCGSNLFSKNIIVAVSAAAVSVLLITKKREKTV